MPSSVPMSLQKTNEDLLKDDVPKTPVGGGRAREAPSFPKTKLKGLLGVTAAWFRVECCTTRESLDSELLSENEMRALDTPCSDEVDSATSSTVWSESVILKEATAIAMVHILHIGITPQWTTENVSFNVEFWRNCGEHQNVYNACPYAALETKTRSASHAHANSLYAPAAAKCANLEDAHFSSYDCDGDSSVYEEGPTALTMRWEEDDREPVYLGDGSELDVIPDHPDAEADDCAFPGKSDAGIYKIFESCSTYGSGTVFGGTVEILPEPRECSETGCAVKSRDVCILPEEDEGGNGNGSDSTAGN